MSHALWRRLDFWMRLFHLYTGLFLVPWMVVYAISAFSLNHGPAITKLLHVAPPKWEVIRREEFVPGDDFPEQRSERAEFILHKLDLEGAHRIQGKPNAPVLTIVRLSGAGHYRIRWQQPQQMLIVERQTSFSGLRFVHYLHFRCGFAQPYFAYRAWALIVDLVSVSILIWVVSGIYLWIRHPRNRKSGGVAFSAGILFFALLVVLLLL